MSEEVTETKPDTGSPEDHLERAAIDRSTRLPVLFFLSSAVAWLFVATILGLIASIKSHSPGFLDWEWTGGALHFLNYGRVQPAFINALVYGWAFQAAIAVAIWIMARLSRVELKNPLTLIVAGHIWNLGVTLGVIGIFAGEGTGMELLEFPAFVWPILLLSYTAIVVWIVVMFVSRTRKEVYVSQWYILGGCFWFPWIYLTANVFVHVLPHFGIGHGVMAYAANSWFASTLVFLFFVPMGLGTIYFLIPKIVGRPIFSYTLSMWAFWSLALFGGWTGMQRLVGGPLPSWMPAVSGMMTILMLIPVVAVAVNHFMTVGKKHDLVQTSPTLRFTFTAAVGFTATCIVAALMTLDGSLHFTIALDGYYLLAFYYFFSMAMFGAIYFILPRAVGCEWLSRRMINLHYLPTVYGILTVICLLGGGAWQNGSFNNWQGQMVGAVDTSNAFYVGHTFCWLLLILPANLIFILHFTLMLFRLGRRTSEPTLLGTPHAETTLATEGAKA